MRLMQILKVLTASLLLSSPAAAVVVDITIESEGQPIPEAQIQFETVDGNPIEVVIPDGELALVEIEETEETDTTETSETPDPVKKPESVEVAESQSETNQSGELTVTLDDAFLGQQVVAVIKDGDKVIKRHQITPSEEEPAVQIEALDPIDALISVAVSQVDKTCTTGKGCGFELVTKNEGAGIYDGPIFFTANLAGSWLSSLNKSNDIHCERAGRGKLFCALITELEPGAEQVYPTAAVLPRRLSRGAQNCIGLQLPSDLAQSKYSPLTAAIQLGLAREGFKPGPADGLMGSKTRRATAAYWKAHGDAEEVSNEKLFEKLYQLPSDRAARLGTVSETNCSPISFKAAKVPAVAKKKSRTRRTTARTTARKNTRDSRAESRRRAIELGVTIGIGILNSRRHRKKKQGYYD